MLKSGGAAYPNRATLGGAPAGLPPPASPACSASPPLVGHLPPQGNHRGHARPRHTLGPCHPGLHVHPLGPVPVPCQDAPPPVDRILLPVSGRGGQQRKRLANARATRPPAVGAMA